MRQSQMESVTDVTKYLQLFINLKSVIIINKWLHYQLVIKCLRRKFIANSFGKFVVCILKIEGAHGTVKVVYKSTEIILYLSLSMS